MSIVVEAGAATEEDAYLIGAADVVAGGIQFELRPSTVFEEAGWRPLGEAAWLDSDESHAIAEGAVLIQFRPVNGYITPPDQWVNVAAGTTVRLSQDYRLMMNCDPEPTKPKSLSFSRDIEQKPKRGYQYNGQVVTDRGAGLCQPNPSPLF